MAGEFSTDWLSRGSIRKNVRVKSAELLDQGPQTTQLIVTSPPDLSETSLQVWDALFSLYASVFSRCVWSLRDVGVLAVVITDRKSSGTVIGKHDRVRSILENQGMSLFAHKVVVRTFKIDLYRMGFSHLMCFRKKTAKRIFVASPAPHEFRSDVWGPYQPIAGLPRRLNSFAPQLVKVLVETFTVRGDLVLDPFCGTGITQRVALGLGRTALGYEVDANLKPHWRRLSGAGGH